MSAAILTFALSFGQIALAVALCLATLRILRGPRAQDRVLALDTLYVNAMLLMVVTGIREGTPFLFEASLVIGMLGFVATVAAAKFLMRGEVIEMNHLETLPLWAAIPAAALVVLGACLALIGSWGLLRLSSFYDRIHAPTLGTSWGTAAIMLASMLVFSVAGSRVVVHELVIGVFIMLTTPVTLMLLGRATLYRDRAEEAEKAGKEEADG